MADWLIKHRLRKDGSLLTTLKPEDLAFTLNSDEPHTISYNVSHASPAVSHDFVGPYRTTFELWRGSTRLMAGLHTYHSTSTRDQFSSIQGKDWSHDLERRHYPFDPRDPSHWYDYKIGTPPSGYVYHVEADVAEIIKTVLDVVYARPYSLPLTYPTLTTNLGISVRFEIAAGDLTYIHQMIKSLSDNYPGFHFEVLPTKELRLYSPHKYDIAVATDPTLANHIYTDADSGLKDAYFTNTGPGGTHIFGRGAGVGGASLGTALGMPGNEEEFGRLDMDADFGDVASQDYVDSRTRGAFNFALQPIHEITVEVYPDVIGESFWTLQRPGEAIWVRKDVGSHMIDSAQEIISQDFTVDNNGNVECNMKLNQIYPDNDPGVPEA